MKEADEQNGVWRTVMGRRIFIQKGEALSHAIKRSGKFSKSEIKIHNDITKSLEKTDKELSKFANTLKKEYENKTWSVISIRPAKIEIKRPNDSAVVATTRQVGGDIAHNFIAKMYIQDDVYRVESNNHTNIKGYKNINEALTDMKKRINVGVRD